MINVYLAGSGSFGLAAAEAIVEDGHALAGICSPPRAAAAAAIPSRSTASARAHRGPTSTGSRPTTCPTASTSFTPPTATHLSAVGRAHAHRWPSATTRHSCPSTGAATR